MGRASSEETRRRIVDAAWTLVEARGAEQLLAGVTLRRVAEAAGVTAPAVSYHFPTLRDLGLAMAERLSRAHVVAPLRDVDLFSDRVTSEGLAPVLRAAVQFRWDSLALRDEARQERAALRLLSSTGSPVDGPELARLAALHMRPGAPDAALAYAQAFERLDLRVIEPFTVEELTRASAAVTHGLLHQWLCEPDAVRPDLAADVVVALSAATVVPAGRRVAIGELTSSWPQPEGARPPTDEELLAHAASAAGCFTEGVDQVTVTELGAAMACEPAAVVEWFGTPRRVAALAFARHLPSMADAAERRREGDLRLVLADLLCELARCAQSDPHCALALAVERLHGDHPTVDDRYRSGVHHLVPLPALIRPLISGLTDHERPGPATLAEVMVDLVLPRAANRPTTSPAAVADLALRLLPPTANPEQV